MCSKLLFFSLIYSFLIILFNFHVVIYSFFEYEFAMYFTKSETNATYDYIVVGCGTAGSLIANYLSFQPNITVLVLEAGGEGSPLLNPPALGPLLQGTSYDWQYETVEQVNSCLAMSGKCKWPSGKIVGGSGKLNNMIHLRNYANEIATWFEGKYSSSQINQAIYEIEKYDLLKEPLKFKTELADTILNAAKELGFRVGNLDDIKIGFMETIVNQKDGARWSTSNTLSQHRYMNNNIKITSNALVEKLVIDSVKRKVNGLIFEKFGKIYQVTAKKGVILTAGAIGTPKILLLSGIGPHKDLKALDIPVFQNLPVGENLMDHVTTGLDLILVSKELNFNLQNFTSPLNALEYFRLGKGSWTSVGCEVVAILNTCDIKMENFNEICEKDNLPDLQLMVMPTGLSNDGGVHLRKILGLNGPVWEDYFEDLIGKNVISILPVVLHPKSKGHLKLRSNDPKHLPIIHPNYFSHQDDINVIIKGIHLIKQLINTKSAKNIGASLNKKLFPGCVYTKFDTPSYWECYAKQLTLTSFHPAGTCKMGDRKSDSTVVDFNFKVLGIGNLFVADASLFPTMPSGNINTAVALLAKLFVKQLITDIKSSL